jgi:hypothetical protein
MTIADSAGQGKAGDDALPGLPTLLIVPPPPRDAYNPIRRRSIAKG